MNKKITLLNNKIIINNQNKLKLTTHKMTSANKSSTKIINNNLQNTTSPKE